jgi:hypothetical protein
VSFSRGTVGQSTRICASTDRSQIFAVVFT